MNETIYLALALMTGVLLGVMFFGGLLWTVHKGLSSKRPAHWFFGSMVLRTSIVLAGFYLVTGSQWERLLLCLVGFTIARFIVSRLTRTKEKTTHLARQAENAPQS